MQYIDGLCGAFWELREAERSQKFYSLMLGREQACQAREYVLAPKVRWVLGAADDPKGREYSHPSSEVAQACLTLYDPMDCSPAGSSVHGIFQARILEWIGIFFFRGSSWPRDQTQASRIEGRLWAHQGISPLRSHSFRKQALPIWNQCVQGNLGNYILDHRVQIKNVTEIQRGEKKVSRMMKAWS